MGGEEVGEEEVGEEAPSLTTGGDEAQGPKKKARFQDCSGGEIGKT